MPRTAIDVGRLQAMTERGRKRAEAKERKARLAEDQKVEREAKKIANRITRELPGRIKSAAREGGSSIDVDVDFKHSQFPMLGRKVQSKVSAWCYRNNLSTSEKFVRYDDDGSLTNYLVVSWPKKQ